MKVRTSAERSIAVAVAVLMAAGSTALAHGVKHRVFPGGTGIQATYDNGSPMAFCDVTVYPPGNQDDEYQTGTTDPHGHFAFVPDTNGVWKLTVDDGMGHLVTAEVRAGPDEPAGGAGDARVSRLTGGIVGVSVIFGLFGIYCMIGRRARPSGFKTGSVRGDGGCTLPKV